MLSLHYTWGNWLITLFLLTVLYLVLRFVDRRIGRIDYFGQYTETVQTFVHAVLLVFEPLALLLLGVVFVMINPVMHGIGLGVLLLVGFNQVRSYFNGRIVQFDDNIKTGNRLSSGKLSGIISGIERLGLRIKTSKGQHLISYTKLLDRGYLVHAGEQVGGYYRLRILLKEQDQKELSDEKLLDLLAAAPYLDWDHKPELYLSEKNPGEINALVSVKEKSHLHDLTALIKEWGYAVNVV